MNLRKLHRKIAPILFIPLLISALTGVAYRIGRSWFGLSDEFGDLMMFLHEGRFLGKPIVPIYVLLVGLGLLGMIVSGLVLVKQRKQSKPVKLNERRLHQILAPIAFLPLGISAITGVGYRLGKAWFGLSSDQIGFLLKIHQGSYLGSALKPIYVLLVGVSLVAMLVTGIQMLGIFRKARPQKQESN
ncbi:MAG: PepSY domain-containing protein [Limnoraphis robusta]